MGIGNDIKLNKKPDVESVNNNQADAISDSASGSEISIDKTGKLKPVYEDIFSLNQTQQKQATDQIDTMHSNKSISPLQPSDDINTIIKSPQKKPSTAPKKRRNHVGCFVVILLIVLIGLLIWQNNTFFQKYLNIFRRQNGSKDTTPSESSVDSAGIETITGQDYASSTEPQTQPTSQPAAAVNTQTPPAPVISTKSSLLIKILNGNGVSGSAASVKSTLESAGYTIDIVKNAASFSYATTIIYYKTGKSAEATELTTTLSGRTTSTEISDSIAGKYDIVVVVGKK